MSNEDPKGVPYEPMSLANKLSDSLELTAWRDAIKRDSITARWSNVFDKIEPTRDVALVAGRLFREIGGGVAPAFIYSIMLTAWSYGYAQACNQLADEEITLWVGRPLNIPDADMEPKEDLSMYDDKFQEWLRSEGEGYKSY